MSDLLLEVRNVAAGYGEVTVLRDVSIDVRRGESVGLLGPNGHGKTTLLRHLSGLHPLRAGSVLFDGEEIGGRSPADIVERGLIHVPQGSRLFPECTVMENLELGAYAKRARRTRRQNLDRVLQLFPKLSERRDQLCRTLSGGERQMVAIGMGLMAAPALLILDEPTLGLAPSIRAELLARIADVRRSGLSLIVVDGDPAFLLELTDRWYGIESGRVFASGASADGLDDQALQELYFGAAHHE